MIKTVKKVKINQLKLSNSSQKLNLATQKLTTKTSKSVANILKVEKHFKAKVC